MTRRTWSQGPGTCVPNLARFFKPCLLIHQELPSLPSAPRNSFPLCSSLERHVQTAMQRIRTWFRARQKRHRNCPGREQSANRPLAVDKPADTPVNKQVNKPKSNQANVSTTPPHVKVQVVSVLDDNDTTTSAISKGLVRLSNAMKIINDLSLAEGTQSVTDTIADIIINVVNTMTTVHDQQKPRRIHAYHVYATRTAIASFIAIRNLVIKPDQSDSGTALSDTFTAYIYFGIATLVTPAPYSARLASALAGLVKETACRRCVWSSKQAYALAEDITRRHTSNRIPPPPPLPDPRPLVSILTSQELAGLARGLAFRQRFTYGTVCTTMEAASILESLFAQLEPVCPCRVNNFPVCFCILKPLSQDECRDLGGRLLPYI